MLQTLQGVAAVLLGEPPRTQYDVHLQLFGFPVRIHPMFWLVALIFGLHGRETKVPELLIWVASISVSILIHELGHALTIRHFGWSSRIILYGMGGLATLENANPYASSYNAQDTPKNKILISLAGPGAGFLLAGIIIACLYAAPIPFGWMDDSRFGKYPDLSGIPNHNLAYLVRSLLFINIFWGLMNLLPVYPLDGGQVARELFAMKGGHGGARAGIEKSLILSTCTGAVVAVLGLLHFGFRDGLLIALLFGYLGYGRQRGWKA